MYQSIINPTIFQIIIPCFFLIITHSSNALITDNNHKLVFTQCSNHTSAPPNPSHIPLLSTLFQEFISQSSKSTFFETLIADEKTAISGSFQCRKDLSRDQCRSCVSKFSNVSKNSCGESLPARIQLNGCYARYQEEEYEDGGGAETSPGPDEFLHRACSKRKIKKRGFEEMKYAAFGEVERCLMRENGFCEMKYESIHVLAQCVESLNGCDCGECVNRVVEIGCEDEECKYSVSGEIYVDGCFLSFDYGDGEFGTYKGGGDKSPRLVAIAVGGLAVLALGVGLCYFAKSCGKKEDDW